jgi:hypothetical protein
VDVDHAIIAKTIKEGVNSPIRSLVERQLAKKKLNVTHIIIFNFVVVVKDSFKKDDEQRKEFLQDHGLLIMKNHSMPL